LKPGESVGEIIRERADKVGDAAMENKTPLQYMLDVMNSPWEPKERRDRMAVAAAPFVHTRAEKNTKKKDQAEAAEKATKGKFAPMAGPKVVNMAR
jgi:phage terminase small subunit